MLNIMDRYLYGDESIFPHASTYYGSLQPPNTSEVAGDPFLPNITIPTIQPFALWVLSAILSSVFLVSTGVQHLLKPLFNPRLIEWIIMSPTPVIIDLLLILVSFLANFVAMGLLNKSTNDYSRMFDDTKTEVTNYVSVGSTFVSLGWMSVLTGSISSILAYVRWRKRRRSITVQVHEMRRLQRGTDGRSELDPPPPYEPQYDESNPRDPA
jgi:hypothetical protein